MKVTRDNQLLPASLREATGPVFHYTSPEGLLGIVGERCVRASGSSSLNDLAEVRQGWTLINEWLNRQKPSPELSRLKSMAANPFDEKHGIFVLSGSTAGDDANQWRLYGRDARGYAVEFRPRVRFVVVSEAATPPAPASARPDLGVLLTDSVTVTPWFHVLYDEKEVARALSQLLRSMKAEVRRIAKLRISRAHHDELHDSLRDDVHEALATIAHLVKAPGFAGENEVRVVAAFVWGKTHVSYRAGAYGIVGYLDLTTAPRNHRPGRVLKANAHPEPRGLPLPIKSVRLGPMLNEEHEKTVAAFLHKHGMECR